MRILTRKNKISIRQKYFANLDEGSKLFTHSKESRFLNTGSEIFGFQIYYTK